MDFKNEFANYIEECCCCYTGEQSYGVLKSTGAGIYLFEVKVELGGSTFDEWLKKLCDDFGNSKNSPKNSPNIIQKRVSYHKENEMKNGEWLPFYVGKRNNLSSRIEQHFTLDKYSPTSSMKLNARTGSMCKYKFRVRILEFGEIISDKSYSILGELIEKRVRKQFSLIVGRQ